MKIESNLGLIPGRLINPEQKAAGADFQNVLTEFIGGVGELQRESQTITKDFILGGNTELHEVMIAGEKAKTSLELLMEIRNKAVDMYKELTRMQI